MHGQLAAHWKTGEETATVRFVLSVVSCWHGSRQCSGVVTWTGLHSPQKCPFQRKSWGALQLSCAGIKVHRIHLSPKARAHKARANVNPLAAWVVCVSRHFQMPSPPLTCAQIKASCANCAWAGHTHTHFTSFFAQGDPWRAPLRMMARQHVGQWSAHTRNAQIQALSHAQNPGRVQRKERPDTYIPPEAGSQHLYTPLQAASLQPPAHIHARPALVRASRLLCDMARRDAPRPVTERPQLRLLGCCSAAANALPTAASSASADTSEQHCAMLPCCRDVAAVHQGFNRRTSHPARYIRTQTHAPSGCTCSASATTTTAQLCGATRRQMCTFSSFACGQW